MTSPFAWAGYNVKLTQFLVVCLVLPLFALLGVSPARGVEIPDLLAVPDSLPDSEKGKFAQTRRELFERLDKLSEDEEKFNKDCGGKRFPPGDSHIKQCLAEKARLTKEAQSCNEAVTMFNRNIEDATRTSINLTRPRMGAVAFVRGDCFILTSDGRKLPITAVRPITMGDHIITGPESHLQIRLLDDTVFTIGPNSDLVMDEFIYDPGSGLKKAVVRFTKGIFRWVTGRVARKNPADIKIKMPVGDIGLRGTDFETTIEPDGSGMIKLFSGKLEITETKTGRVLPLDAGSRIRFTAKGIFNQPEVLKESDGVGIDIDDAKKTAFD